MKCYFLTLAVLFPVYSVCNMAPQGFERFINQYFVETGTYVGDGVKFALRAKFPEIHSIEIDYNLYNRNKGTFRAYPNVHIWYGDSSIDLWNIIKDLNQPITFWLDGHCCPPRTDGGKNTPLMEELDQIKRHPIKTHTILIDDMHCCGTILFDFLTKDQIAEKIREINQEYTISFVDGGDAGEYKDNIMVARIQ